MIARGLGLTGLCLVLATNNNKAALIETVVRKYKMTLDAFTIPQIEEVLNAKNILAPTNTRKREMIQLAVEAGF